MIKFFREEVHADVSHLGNSQRECILNLLKFVIIYIYIYIKREREREKERYLFLTLICYIAPAHPHLRLAIVVSERLRSRLPTHAGTSELME